MKVHYKTHFENENVFLEKWKVINPFLRKEVHIDREYVLLMKETLFLQYYY